jgi:two-component system, sensor histidine kinase
VTAESGNEGQAATFTSPRRVLLVEDNRDIVELIQMQLEMWGHEVSTAADGPSGLQEALRLRPDVALVDVGLPGMDGYDVARQIRSAEGGDRIRLVAMTGYGRPEDRDRALAAGFDAHLVKPVDPRQLQDAIDSEVLLRR